MEHKRDIKGIRNFELMKFSDWIDLLFEDWFVEYCKQNSSNCEDMRGPLYRAFKDGWEKCENFYS